MKLLKSLFAVSVVGNAVLLWAVLHLGSRETALPTAPSALPVDERETPTATSVPSSPTAHAAPSTTDAPPPTRSVVLVFEVPPESPRPEGKVEFLTLADDRTGPELWSDKILKVPVQDGRAELTVRVPNKLSLRWATFPRHVVQPRRIEVSDGTEPLLVTLPTTPAGSVAVRLNTPDGNALSGWSFSYVDHSGDPPEEVHRRSRERGSPAPIVIPHRTDETGRLLVTGLPLGSDFRLIAHQASVMALSPVIRLAADDPVQPLEWTIPEPASFRARLASPDGAPIAEARLKLTHWISTPWLDSDAHGWNSRRGFTPGFFTTTDARGEFSLPINFDIPGHYEFAVEVPNTATPAVIKIDPGTPRIGHVFHIPR